ncbi:MAG TPA: Clp protease N-terminal domain-containing protein [Blastococcus sp.]|nr:Clp protease N-terminal domain-containing protein [Blastococcus sp.]
MFERFTQAARQVVVDAQAEARELQHGWVGTEHLLLALLEQSTPASEVLGRHGLTRRSVRAAVASTLSGVDLDADALTTLGIDLAAVRDKVEEAFGPGALDGPGPRAAGREGHLPFTRRAKKVLELALREAIALKDKTIGDGHIALGLLREGEGLAMKVLADHGVDPVALRRDLTATLHP